MIDEALQSGRLTLGPIGANLEAEFAARHQVQHAIAVASGTSALEIVLRAVGVAGREVLVPANTFFATAAAVIAAGATPRFVDCDPATMALDPASVAGAARPADGGGGGRAHRRLRGPQRARAAGAVRRRGCRARRGRGPRPRLVAGRHQSAGTFGVAGSFSFYPTKVIAGGEGGMIVTDDEHIADEARIYRDQGKASFLTNVHTRLGYNWRMSEPHAAIALTQLRRLDEFIAHRTSIAAGYDAALPELGLTPVRDPDRCGHATTTSTSPTCPTASTGRCSRSGCARSSTSACRARCTRCRCTSNRCSSRGPRDHCRAPRSSAPVTSACRCRR